MTNEINNDEIPWSVNTSGSYNFELKMAEMEAEYERKRKEENDEFNWPLEKRILSKNWKCRKSALEEINKLIKETNEFNMETFKLFPRIINEQHQSNLEYSVDLLRCFLEKEFNIPIEGHSHLNNICKHLIEKCYSSLKAPLKEKGKELLVKCVENLPNTEVLCENINNFVESKNQKWIQAGVTISTHLLSLFGNNAFSYKLILPNLIKLTQSCSPMIKNDIIDFIGELYKWIRGGVKQYIDNKIKDSIQNDLNKWFEAQALEFEKGFVVKATKHLNSGGAVNMGNRGKEESNQGQFKKMEIDDDDDCEVDLFNNKAGFGERYVEDIMKPELNWKGKKEMLDMFISASAPCNIIKLKNTNRIYFTEMLKILLKDPNINVIHSVIIVIGNLSHGLKDAFVEGREFFLLILEFFKEKKDKITHDLFVTWKYLISSLDENVVNDMIIKYSNQSLSTQSKEKICRLVLTILEVKASANIKPLIETIWVKYTDDSIQEVRNASISTWAAIKTKNNNLLWSSLSWLNDAKKKRINDIASAESSEENTNINTLINHNSTIHMTKSEGNNNSYNNLTNKQAKQKEPKGAPVNDEPQLDSGNNQNVNNDEILEYFQNNLGSETFALFTDSKWENRSNAFISLTTYINENKEQANNNMELFVKFLWIQSKQLKENNINIIKEALISIKSLCTECITFTKQRFHLAIIKRLIDRFGDQRLKPLICELFKAMIVQSSVKAVANSMIKNAENKPVVIWKEVAIFLTNIIEDYGISVFPIKEIVDFCKVLEANSNPQCRSSGTGLLCKWYKYIGDPIRAFLTDIKESTLKLIEAEFSKITVEVQVANPCGGKPWGNKGNPTKFIDNWFPRTDISKKITQKMLKDISEGKWQLKKEVLDNIEKIIKESQFRILPNGLGDLIGVIKQKLKELNKNMTRIWIQFIAKLTDALGVGIKVYIKTLWNPILKNLSDKMNLLREDIVKCLEKFIEFSGFESIAWGWPPFLSEENYEIRNELLKWLLKYSSTLPKLDCWKEFIPPTISCLLDKSPVIRTHGEELAKEILKHVNINSFYHHWKDFKPAIAEVIRNIIDKYSSLICINEENVVMKDCTAERSVSVNVNNRNVKSGVNPNHEVEIDNRSTVRKAESRSNEQKGNNRQIPSLLSNMPLPTLTNLNVKINYQIENRVNDFSVNPLNSGADKSNSTTLDQYPQNRNVQSYMISSSPFILNKTKEVSDSNIKDIATSNWFQVNPETQTQLKNIISAIYTGDINSKSAVLMELSDLINSRTIYPLSKSIIDSNVNDIFKALCNLLSTIFNIDNIRNWDSSLLRYLFMTFYRWAINKDLLSHLWVDSIYLTYTTILDLLLKDSLYCSVPDGKKISKSLNGLMWKLMENIDVTNSLISLIQLITDQRNSSNNILGLGVKCLLKLSNIINEIFETLNVDRVLQKICYCWNEFNRDNSNNAELAAENPNEEMIFKAIKTLINELVKKCGDGIWNSYQKSIEDVRIRDQHLKRWIQIIIHAHKSSCICSSSDRIKLSNESFDKLRCPMVSMKSNTGSNQNNMSLVNQELQGKLNNSTSSAHSIIENLSGVSIVNNSICSNINTNNNHDTFLSNNHNLHQSKSILSKIDSNTNKSNSNTSEILDYINKINTFSGQSDEKEKLIYGIIELLKRNKINVDFLNDKINESDYFLLLRIYYSVRNYASQSESGSNFISKDKDNTLNNQLLNQSNQKSVCNINLKGQMKTWQDYRNKWYGLSGSPKNESVNSYCCNNPAYFSGKTIGSGLNTFAPRKAEEDEWRSNYDKKTHLEIMKITTLVSMLPVFEVTIKVDLWITDSIYKEEQK